MGATYNVGEEARIPLITKGREGQLRLKCPDCGRIAKYIMSTYINNRGNDENRDECYCSHCHTSVAMREIYGKEMYELTDECFG